jgi:2-succinyl-5-enolpyruvyl-6-hydroxy-3-cyclohexene-1-carboxylate synthase
MAHQETPSLLLTGDLSLLHDTNGFLIRPYFRGHLTIILINNNGGGIFEMLAIASKESYFENYFATPQSINFAKLCVSYNVDYFLINDQQTFVELISNLPQEGIRLLEIKTDRKADAAWLKKIGHQLAFLTA